MDRDVTAGAGLDWPAVLDHLLQAGWTAAVVDAARLDEVSRRVDEVLASGELPGATVDDLGDQTSWSWPIGVPEPRSVVVAATPRPLTRATFTVGGRPHEVIVPPEYAEQDAVAESLADALRTALSPAGHSAALFEPPLKTLATCAGLARYGRNNIAFVPGLGSYLMLAACASDAPPPDDSAWGAPQQLERCERCSACLRACPTGAIHADRFLLQTDRCLPTINEAEEEFPAWVDPEWHHVAVGCLRCQQSCPENAGVELIVAEPEVFDAEESAAILAASTAMAPETRAKLSRCGLDFMSPAVIARNLRALGL
jgi:epoxyqueuosine reductase